MRALNYARRCFVHPSTEGRLLERWRETFSKRSSDRARENDFTLKYGVFRLHFRKKFFTVKMARPWNRLPEDVGDVPSLEVLKDMLDLRNLL